MGHNKSQAWYRAQLLGYAIGDLRTGHLMVRCWKCGDERHLPVATLVARYGPDPRLNDVVHRLRCRFPSCRSKPDQVRFLSRHVSEGPGECSEMILVGQGAL